MIIWNINYFDKYDHNRRYMVLDRLWRHRVDQFALEWQGDHIEEIDPYYLRLDSDPIWKRKGWMKRLS